MKSTAALGILMLLLACVRPSGWSSAAEDAYLRDFLSAWLTAENAGQASAFLHPFFQAPASQSGPQSLPGSDEFPQLEPSLAYASLCSGVRLRCSEISDCITSASGTSTLYDLQSVPVTDELVSEFPSLSDLRGQRITTVETKLRSCNIAVVILLDHSSTKRRVRSIMYIAR